MEITLEVHPASTQPRGGSKNLVELLIRHKPRIGYRDDQWSKGHYWHDDFLVSSGGAEGYDHRVAATHYILWADLEAAFQDAEEIERRLADLEAGK